MNKPVFSTRTRLIRRSGVHTDRGIQFWNYERCNANQWGGQTDDQRMTWAQQRQKNTITCTAFAASTCLDSARARYMYICLCNSDSCKEKHHAEERSTIYINIFHPNEHSLRVVWVPDGLPWGRLCATLKAAMASISFNKRTRNDMHHLHLPNCTALKRIFYDTSNKRTSTTRHTQTDTTWTTTHTRRPRHSWRRLCSFQPCNATRCFDVTTNGKGKQHPRPWAQLPSVTLASGLDCLSRGFWRHEQTKLSNMETTKCTE